MKADEEDKLFHTDGAWWTFLKSGKSRCMGCHRSASGQKLSCKPYTLLWLAHR